MTCQIYLQSLKFGLGIAVANACSTVAEVAKWQTLKQVANGAVRELAEMLLTAQGKWARAVSSYQ
jgi:3-deoxy-D-manno-octulosonate 8-phosphate phosphatase KdsC-like HAD superfamily phosphatase